MYGVGFRRVLTSQRTSSRFENRGHMNGKLDSVRYVRSYLLGIRIRKHPRWLMDDASARPPRYTAYSSKAYHARRSDRLSLRAHTVSINTPKTSGNGSPQRSIHIYCISMPHTYACGSRLVEARGPRITEGGHLSWVRNYSNH